MFLARNEVAPKNKGKQMMEINGFAKSHEVVSEQLFRKLQKKKSKRESVGGVRKNESNSHHFDSDSSFDLSLGQMEKALDIQIITEEETSLEGLEIGEILDYSDHKLAPPQSMALRSLSFDAKNPFKGLNSLLNPQNVEKVDVSIQVDQDQTNDLNKPLKTLSVSHSNIDMKSNKSMKSLKSNKSIKSIKNQKIQKSKTKTMGGGRLSFVKTSTIKYSRRRESNISQRNLKEQITKRKKNVFSKYKPGSRRQESTSQMDDSDNSSKAESYKSIKVIKPTDLPEDYKVITERSDTLEAKSKVSLDIDNVSQFSNRRAKKSINKDLDDLKSSSHSEEEQVKMPFSPVRNAKFEIDDSEDSLIRIFSLKNKDNLEVDEESVSDLQTYIDNIDAEELQSELPRRIFNASRVVAQCIAELDKDEYGDYIYREQDGNDKASNRLKKASEMLKFWLNLLKSANRFKKGNTGMSAKSVNAITEDKEVQTETDKRPSLKRDIGSLKRNFKSKQSLLRSSEAPSKNSSPSNSTKRSTYTNNKNLTARGSFQITPFASKELLAPHKKEVEHNTTTARPFHFTNVKAKHDVGKGVNSIYKLVQGVKTSSYLAVRTVSVKVVLKTMHSLYYEKAANVKDSRIIENQTLVEYLYDAFVHKYGIGKLAEKKVKEILVTVKTKKNIASLQIFGKFLNLLPNAYTTDDLKFYFYLNRVMVQSEVVEARPYFKKENNFEADLYHARPLVNMFNNTFAEIMQFDRFENELKRLKEFISNKTRVEIDELEEKEFDIEVNAYAVQEYFLQFYTDMKMEVLLKIVGLSLLPVRIKDEVAEACSTKCEAPL